MQSIRKCLRKSRRERSRFALIHHLRVIIIKRRLATAKRGSTLKRKFTFRLRIHKQYIRHIKLVFKGNRQRRRFIRKENRKRAFPPIKRNP